MSQGEIARLREQIEQAHAASVWALTGLSSGTAQHAFITEKLHRMDGYHWRLMWDVTISVVTTIISVAGCQI